MEDPLRGEASRGQLEHNSRLELSLGGCKTLTLREAMACCQTRCLTISMTLCCRREAERDFSSGLDLAAR